LFLFVGEIVLIDALIHLLKLKLDKLLKMDMEELFQYIRLELVKECVREYGINNCIPKIKSINNV